MSDCLIAFHLPVSQLSILSHNFSVLIHWYLILYETVILWVTSCHNSCFVISTFLIVYMSTYFIFVILIFFYIWVIIFFYLLTSYVVLKLLLIITRILNSIINFLPEFVGVIFLDLDISLVLISPTHIALQILFISHYGKRLLILNHVHIRATLPTIYQHWLIPLNFQQ